LLIHGGPALELRELVYEHIVHDIKRLNLKAKNNQLNRTLQNFMYTMLADSNESAAKRSLDVMIELYRKKIWDDAKTVNVISGACFSTCTKILVAGLQFFIGEKDLGRRGSDDESDEQKPQMSMKDVMKKYSKLGAKKTRKKEKKLRDAINKVNRERKSAAPKPNFPAIQLLHDPQGASVLFFFLL
jgi:protein SDA1